MYVSTSIERWRWKARIHSMLCEVASKQFSRRSIFLARLNNLSTSRISFKILFNATYLIFDTVLSAQFTEKKE
jgi:hypothetical protein